MGIKNLSRRFFGFTFVELMIAITIFATVITAIYFTFHTGIRSWKRIEQDSNIYQEIRLAIADITRQLQNACPFSAENIQTVPFDGKGNSISFFSVVSFSDDPNILELAKINYEFLDGKLICSKIPVKDLLKSEPLEQDSYNEDILEVDNVGFEYYYKSNEENGNYAWKETWPKDPKDEEPNSDVIPRAVKIAFTVNDEVTKTPLEIEKLILINCGKEINE